MSEILLSLASSTACRLDLSTNTFDIPKTMVPRRFSQTEPKKSCCAQQKSIQYGAVISTVQKKIHYLESSKLTSEFERKEKNGKRKCSQRSLKRDDIDVISSMLIYVWSKMTFMITVRC